MRSTLIVVLAVLTGCAKRSYPEPPVHRDIREPDRDSIESVLYLVGDAGQATLQNSPVLRRLRSEVEDWSNTLTRENSLVVLYLGDNVYPRGLRDRTDPGWAQDSTHLQSQIDVEGVSDIVELPGYAPDTALRSLAHRAGVVVVPSLYEPFGIVALEALAAGAPLIVARTGGLAELLADTEAGITFEPGNPEDLARCIAEVLTDPDLAAGLMSHGRALVEQTYAWDAIASATAAVYDGLLTSTIR